LYSYIGKYKTQIIASGGYLFFTFNNASKAPHLKPSSFGQKIAEICDRLEMGDHIIMANGNKARRIGTHSLRRLFTSELYKQTKDIRVVRDVLHHANAEITSRYISSILFDDEQKQVEKLARNLIKPTPTFTDR
jgi:integrase